jgi:hypothetical protein
MEIGLSCWRCEEPGHVAAECKREPPKNPQELSERNRRYVQLWGDGLITTAQKAKWIADEMKAFKPKKARAK